MSKFLAVLFLLQTYTNPIIHADFSAPASKAPSRYRMSADGTHLLDDGKTVFDGRAHHPTIEGPKLYKRNGYYYIFAPAGGVTSGWQTVLRSKNINGPYEDRIVMDQGQTNINGPQGRDLRLNQENGSRPRLVCLRLDQRRQTSAAMRITTGSGSSFPNNLHKLARALGDQLLLPFTNRLQIY